MQLLLYWPAQLYMYLLYERVNGIRDAKPLTHVERDEVNEAHSEPRYLKEVVSAHSKELTEAKERAGQILPH